VTRRFVSGLVPPDPRPERALWFVFRGRELLVRDDLSLESMAPPQAPDLGILRSQYLGRLGEEHCFSAEVAQGHPAPSGMRFQDLRMLFGRLDETLHALAGRAVQIVEWDRTHLFCGACGGSTESRSTERSRVCTRCGHTCFPRLAPAVIVAVERDGEILLARSPHFPPGFYSVPAGFVEPGETLEETVAREIHEETGIEVKDIRYFASQPWPFPHSLMLGFTARYARGEIQIDRREIEDAAFFRYDSMPPYFRGRISISGWLIEHFLEKHSGGKSLEPRNDRKQ
jgi:NAD+ diphosphatase